MPPAPASGGLKGRSPIRVAALSPPLPRKQPDSAVQKTSKKVEKKACQVSESSINEEKLADKPADFPFKNILKK
jgi:hypothetical protein